MAKVSAYHDFLKEIKERIRFAQYDALKVVNKEMIHLYWDIGKKIVEEQERHGWGKAVVVNLARDLQAEFPGISGYSADNLWRMRKFYLHFRKNPKLAPLVQEISWTKDVLIHQIENKTYEKTLINQTNFNKNLPSPIKAQAKLAVKDEYTFDFLELSEDHSEKLRKGHSVAICKSLLIKVF